MTSCSGEIERRTQRIGRELFARARAGRWARARRKLGPSEMLLRSVSRDEYTRTSAFRFTALLPLIHADDRRIAEHITQYFTDARLHPSLRYPALLAHCARRLPGARSAVDRIVGRTVVTVLERSIAGRFFAGERLTDALRVRDRLIRRGYTVSLDVLGETCASDEEADRYMEEYLGLLDGGVDDVSLKLSALDPRFDPVAAERTLSAVGSRLARILSRADATGAAVTVDMEQYTHKELTLRAVIAAARTPGRAPLSVAVQTYVRDETAQDLLDLERAAADACRPLGIRLVKGANWDSDTVLAARRGWPNPLFDRKDETDRAFEHHAAGLFERRGALRKAFGTHNVRSIAWVLACAEAAGAGREDLEFQFLYGMIPEELAEAVTERGWRVRYYTPYGQLLPGLAYLVRRLLENSSNNSFLKRLSFKSADIDRQMAVPVREAVEPARRMAAPPAEAVPSVGSGIESCRAIAARIRDASPERAAAWSRAADDALSHLERTGKAVVGCPGERNELIFRPRGIGIVYAGVGAAPEEFAYALGAAVSSGGPVYWASEDASLRSPEGAGTLRVESTGERWAELIGSPDLAWICVVGSLREGSDLREKLAEHPESRRTPPRWIDARSSGRRLWIEMTAVTTVCENTLLAGFASGPVSCGGPEGYANHPETRWHESAVRRQVEQQGQECDLRLISEGPVMPLIDGRPIATGRIVPSEDPCRPDRPIADVHWADERCVEQALESSRAAFAVWARTSVSTRTSVLRNAARLTAQRRYALARLVAREAAKPIEEAVREIDEAIDFFNYYAALEQTRRDGAHPRGVTAVISPWNFPYAIPAGMIAAAIVTGNSVVFKSAEQTCVTAHALVRLFFEAGLPAEVLQFLPGSGEETGAALVGHEAVRTIVFTGSREVGLWIHARALRRPGPAPSVIAEMGGKNAIIVDEDVDPDEAAAAIITSAFGYAGQKCSACSRVIALPGIRSELEQRLSHRFAAMVVGDPLMPGTRMSALIDAAAVDKTLSAIALGRREGLRLLALRDLRAERHAQPDGAGRYASAAIFTDVPVDSALFGEEIFGPVLCVTGVADLDEALRAAHATPYALTGGLYSQSPAALRKIRMSYEVGDLYLNRAITGALVGRQPFGGLRHSGLGAKAGGPDYLGQFTEYRR